MSKNIIQKVVFRNTFPKILYDLYMNAKKHSLATGAMAKINSKEGSKFSAHGCVFQPWLFHESIYDLMTYLTKCC